MFLLYEGAFGACPESGCFHVCVCKVLWVRVDLSAIGRVKTILRSILRSFSSGLFFRAVPVSLTTIPSLILYSQTPTPKLTKLGKLCCATRVANWLVSAPSGLDGVLITGYPQHLPKNVLNKWTVDFGTTLIRAVCFILQQLHFMFDGLVFRRKKKSEGREDFMASEKVLNINLLINIYKFIN